MRKYEIDNLIGELLISKKADYHPDYLKKLSTLHKVIDGFLSEGE